MSLPEERLKVVYDIFTKGWQFLKELLKDYPEFPQKKLSEEQWEEIIQKQAEKYEEVKKLYEDKALLTLYRSLSLAAINYMEKEGEVYADKKD